MPTVDLPCGRIHYEEAGPPDARPVVCLHGFVADAELWRELRPRLADRGLRCITPTLPMGAHRERLKPGTDLSPPGVARIVATFLEALDLRDVVLMGNDSGGAVAQMVAVDHGERLGALLLTNCDTREHFPPAAFKWLVLLPRIPAPALKVLLRPLRTRAGRRAPTGFGLLSHTDIDDLAREWVRPVFEVDGVLEDAQAFVRGADPEMLVGVAERLRSFGRPVVLAWGMDDRAFKLSQAERLAQDVPGARVVPVPGSRTFVMLDQPDRLAEIVTEVAQARAPSHAPA